MKEQVVTMQGKNNSSKDERKKTVEIIRDIAVALGAIVAVVSGILAIREAYKGTIITVNNHLALPIIVKINDSVAYTGRVEADSSKTFRLNSKDDFPAKVEWKLIRRKNNLGKEVGEALSNIYPRTDRGGEINVTNVIGEKTYFYPVINNNTDQQCSIVINDKILNGFQVDLGFSNPNRQANLTGYFKYANNSNITMYCDGKPFWHGIRFKQDAYDDLPIEEDSGITEVNFP